jgi:ferredoxin
MKMDSTRKKKLKRLAKMMNKQTTRPVPTFIGATIKVLDSVLTPDETEFLLAMDTERYTRASLEKKMHLSEEDFKKIFNSLIQKGMIWSQSEGGDADLFEISPMMVGWFELQISNGKITPNDEKFLKSLSKLFNSFKKFNSFLGRPIVNLYYRLGGAHWSVARTVKVDETIDVPESSIIRSGDIREIIERYGNQRKLAVSHCVCRQHWAFNGEPCRLDLPTEAHIWLGSAADHVVNYKLGRRISKEEAFAIIKEVEEKGGIHEIMYDRMDLEESELCICNCCWDCCNSIGAFNRGQLPLYIKSYYLATIPDEALCTACGTCIDYCPTLAISIKNEKAKIETKRCIGCGQCELKCPNDVIKLTPKERTVWLPMQKKSKCRIES